MTVEAMLVMGILFSLSFGMTEFGYCFYCKSMLMGAAREGARVAITPGATPGDVNSAVTKALASTKWTPTKYTIAVTDTANNPMNLATVTVGTAVQVTVSGSWGTLGNGMSPMHLIGATKQIAGVCAMRKEQ